MAGVFNNQQLTKLAADASPQMAINRSTSLVDVIAGAFDDQQLTDFAEDAVHQKSTFLIRSAHLGKSEGITIRITH